MESSVTHIVAINFGHEPAMGPTVELDAVGRTHGWSGALTGETAAAADGRLDAAAGPGKGLRRGMMVAGWPAG